MSVTSFDFTETMSPTTDQDQDDPRALSNPVGRLSLKKFFYLLVAGIFFVVGVLGALLPGLPATPFLLVTSFFLIRSSPRLNETLLRSRFFGPILKDWQVRGGVRRGVKVKSIIIVILFTAATLIWFDYSRQLKTIVTMLSILGILVILRLPNARPVINTKDDEQ